MSVICLSTSGNKPEDFDLQMNRILKQGKWIKISGITKCVRLTLRLLMSYIYGAPNKARNTNVVYIWTYVWQR